MMSAVVDNKFPVPVAAIFPVCKNKRVQLKKIRRLFLASTLLFPTLVFSTSTTLKADTIYHPRPASTLHWHPCKDGLPGSDCALLTVPLDYVHPHNGTIKIGITRIKALNSKQRIGTLFVNSGGPGADGDDALYSFVPTFSFKTEPSAFLQRFFTVNAPLHEHFDLIGFDPRGIGRGTQLKCPTSIAPPQIPYPPATEKEYNSLLRYNHQLGIICEHLAGPLIHHVDTWSVIQDVDNIRKALGEKTISYFGWSYGTEIGQLYAEKYPTHLRVMILDSDINHAETDLFKEIREDAASEEKTLQDLNQLCHRSVYCKTPGKNIIKNLDILLNKAQRKQLRTVQGKIIPPENITYILVNLLYDASIPDNFTEINHLFTDTPKVRMTLAKASPYMDFTADNIFQKAVICHDFILPNAIPSYARYHAEITRLKTIAPHMWRTSVRLAMSLPCFNWPISPQNPPAPLHIPANVPILLLANKADPATAPASSIALHQEIPGSRLITTDAIGHPAYVNSHCATVAEINYLLTAKLPWFDEHCSG